MTCINYIICLLKSHGWDTVSPKPLPSETTTLPKDAVPPDPVPTTTAAASIGKVQVQQHHEVPLLPSTKDDECDSCNNIKLPKIDTSDIMHSSKPISPLPTDSIEQMYAEEGPLENTTAYFVLEKKKGFNYYHILLGELMYAYITCQPDIGYAVTTLLKFLSVPIEYH